MSVQPVVTTNPLQAATRRKVRTWFGLWGAPELAGAVEIRFSDRLRASLGRCRPARGRVVLNGRLRDDSPARLHEVLCHELAHIAVHHMHGPTGLRQREGKTLRVIDYIGNHRVFLVKTRVMLSLGDADRDVAYALTALEQGTFELPPGCSVTYDLEAKNMLQALVRPTGAAESLEEYYREFVARHGVRPRAMEAFSDGFNPRALRRDYGSCFVLIRFRIGYSGAIVQGNPRSDERRIDELEPLGCRAYVV